MPNLTADRVKETTTTTGTGTVTLAGAVAQFRSFASAFADASVVQYAIVGQTGTEWEVGNGTFTASGTTLARTTVLASSNAGAAVNLSAGTKDVFATATADHLLNPVFTRADVDNLRLDGNTLSSTNTNGDITLAPNGTGKVQVSDGTKAQPSIAVNGASNTGIYMTAINGLFATTFNGVQYFQLYPGIMAVPSFGIYAWTDAGEADASRDTALAKSAAGVVKVTDASSGIRGLLGGGAAVASAAALPVPTGRVFHVTGTTNITSITSTNFQTGVVITMIFDGVLTVTDGSNLKLAGNFVTAADSTLSLVYDGTNWYETSRSAN